MGEVDYHHLLTSSGWHCFDDYRNVYAEDGTLVYDAPFELNLDESVPSFYIHGVPYWLNPEGLLSLDADGKLYCVRTWTNKYYFHTSSGWYFFDDHYNVYLEDGTLVHDDSPNAEMGGLLSPTFYIDGASYWFALDVLWYQASIDTVYRVHTWQSQPGNNPNSLYCFSASDQFYYLDTRRNLYSKAGKLLYDGSSSMLTDKLHAPNFYIDGTAYWLHKDGLLSRSADDTMCRVLAWVQDLYSFHTPNGLHHFDRHQNVYSDKGIRLHNRSHYAKSDGVTPLIFQVDSDSYWFDLGRANVSEEGKQDDGVHAMIASFGNFKIDSAQEYEGGARCEPQDREPAADVKPKAEQDEQDDTEVSYSFHTPNGLRYFDRHRNVYSDKGIRVHMGDLWCQVSTNIYRVHTWKSELNRHSPDKKYCFFTSGHFYYPDDHQNVYSEDGTLFYDGSSSVLADNLLIANFHIGFAAYWLHKDGLLSRSDDGIVYRILAWVRDSCSLNGNPDPLQKGLQGVMPLSIDPSCSESPSSIKFTTDDRQMHDTSLFAESDPDYIKGTSISLHHNSAKHAIKMTQPRKRGNKDHLICPICGKKSRRPVAYEEHMRIHTGEKPNVCPFKGCTAAFATRSNMKRHFETHRAGCELEKYETCGSQATETASVPPGSYNPPSP